MDNHANSKKPGRPPKIKSLAEHSKAIASQQEKNEKDNWPEVILKWRAKNGRWLQRTIKCATLEIQEESFTSIASKNNNKSKQIWLSLSNAEDISTGEM